MSRPLISLVVAVAENGVIGRGGGLPWRLRSDLRRFRAITLGKPVVMGRKTFDSIGKPLDGRDNIVITRRRDFGPEGVEVAHTIGEALTRAGQFAERRGVDEICVIGGSEVFLATLPLASRLHVTHVEGAPEGDVFFPAISAAEWEEARREPLPFSEGDTGRASYAVYQRRT